MSKVNTKPLHETINEAAQAETLFDKVQKLQRHNSTALRKLLRYAIDTKLKFYDFGDIVYRPNQYDGCETLLHNRARLLYLFTENGNKPLSIAHRTLIEVLEEIDAKDAELLIQIIKKKLPKGLTKPIVQQAFPGILDEQELP